MRRILPLIFILSLCVESSHLLAQQLEIVKGKVVEATTKEPLVGVSVIIEETKQGVITDIDGNFTLNAPTGSVLVFQMVGMKTQKVTVTDNSFLNISLEENIEQLGEVVVTGFQEVNRRLFTGASESLQLKDVQIQGMADVSRMLEGQVAGVTVDNVSGTFGTTPKIRIRGNSSINGNNQPLFVVDGVILEDLNNVSTEDFTSGDVNTLVSSSIANLNPSDIESFQILKDASATAIYGARAANGVVVITTKRGRSGDLRVNYSGNFSGRIRPTYNQFNLLNSAEEMAVYREMFEKGLIDIGTAVQAQNYGAMGKMFSLINQKELNWGRGGTLNEEFLNQYENANTDWFDVLFRNFGLQQQHALSFTTGSEKSNNYYSVSYLNDQGQTIADRVQRFTGTARSTYFISDSFDFGLKFSGSYRQQKVPGTRSREFDPISGRFSRDFDINPFSYALNTARSIRPYDENGELEFFRRNFADFNIIRELDLNFIDIEVADVSIQSDFEFRPLKNLTIKSVVQGRYAATTRDHTAHEDSNQAEAYRADQTQFIQQSNNLLFQDPTNPGLNPVVVLPEGGFNFIDQSDLINFYNRNSIEWGLQINEKHDINVLAGQEIRYTDRSSTSTTGLGVSFDNGGSVVTDPNIIQFFNLQNIDFFEIGEERDRFVGLFLNGAYAYKEKYIANFTVRYDGSNQLGESNNARFLPTWNVSGAWNIHKEAFMESFSVVNELKLRGTYGLSGNLPPNVSALLNLQSDVTIRPTDVESFLFIQDLTNDELTWEKLRELNIGVDFSLMDNRISGSLNYFRRNAFDLIGTVQTSGIGGQGLKTGNFADMEANGYEISITTQNINTKDFSWTTNFNLGFTKDVITKLDFGPRLADAIEQNGAAVLNGPRRGLYSTNFAGLDNFGIPQFFNESGELVYALDLQERANLQDVLLFEGPTEPRGAGGFSSVMRYKNFTLNVLLSFKYDYQIRLNDAFNERYTDFDALPGELRDRWAVSGDEDLTNIPVILDNEFLAGNATINGQFSDAYALYNRSNVRVVDGDYIRLKNVRLSYQIPTNVVQRLGLSNASVSLEGQNLALLLSDPELDGQDPEFFATGGVALPQPRQITFTLNLGL